MDALSSLLQVLHPRGHIFFTGEYCGDFAVDTSGNGFAHFHVIAQGQCWLQVDGWEDQRPLSPGDLVMFPHDARHALLPHPPGETVIPAEEGFVSLICGYFEFASRRANPILTALPEVLVLRSDNRPQNGWLAELLEFMKYESNSDAPGAAMVIDRLSEVLFLYILRDLIDDPRQRPEFLRAFADPSIARALFAIHEEPQQPWTVASLADTAALSRTAFANRFHELVGMTPLGYLTRFRMDLATEWLRQGELNMDEIAERSGYASAAAFAKAYKKESGVTPGSVRRASV